MKRIAITTALLAACLAGCNQSNDNGIGPAQQAGKTLDDAGAKVTAKMKEEVGKADEAAARARAAAPDAVAKARENLDQMTDKVGKKVEEAGQKMQEKAK